MVIEVCRSCGSDEVYRGLNRKRIFWTWYMLTMLGATVRLFFVLTFIGAAVMTLLPFAERWRCRNCGEVLS